MNVIQRRKLGFEDEVVPFLATLDLGFSTLIRAKAKALL